MSSLVTLQQTIHTNTQPVIERLNLLNWSHIDQTLNQQGWCVINSLFSTEECLTTAAMYTNESLYRKRIIMNNHGFGRGEYQYFRYPLPDLIAQLRTALYSHLQSIANQWNEAMNIDVRYPEQHKDFIDRCHQEGQNHPTPLILQYNAGDYNCLHQDLYGKHMFPLQASILLSQPEQDFKGGEFVLTEQRPRMQSRAHVIPLSQGDALIFAVHQRPVQGSRSLYRVNLRHGVSEIRSGHRHTLGVIFHDAQS
ncbi:MAG: 2OG-Fe(II) oxygenase [Gammaproteobacteria bacterium]|nr:2OG-Fe(II) oxygenase [Gammaproteobacteria bacterium]